LAKRFRIIYSAGNRIGSRLQLTRFIKHIDNDYELKIAGHIKSTYDIPHVDWLLNSKVNDSNIENIIKDVIEFNPDLIISDNEYLFGRIANEINIPLWYCSPLNLIDGIEFKGRSIYSYFYHEYKVHKLPQAEKYLIYSPFCDIKNEPKLKNGYEWVRPYFEESITLTVEEIERKKNLNKIFKYVKAQNDYTFTDGNTDIISDSFYNNKKIIVSPKIKNVESLVNAELIDRYGIGYNLGQVELMNMLAIEKIENAYNKKYNEILFNSEDNLQLHDKIEKALTI
jgi:hypothetical protein